MLSDVKQYYGLARDLGKSGYFETAQSQQTFIEQLSLEKVAIKELRLAIKDSKLVALSGIVGSGKSMTLQRIQDTLIQEKEILVAKSPRHREEQDHFGDPDAGLVPRSGYR